jgi:hypothetical protein
MMPLVRPKFLLVIELMCDMICIPAHLLQIGGIQHSPHNQRHSQPPDAEARIVIPRRTHHAAFAHLWLFLLRDEVLQRRGAGLDIAEAGKTGLRSWRKG